MYVNNNYLFVIHTGSNFDNYFLSFRSCHPYFFQILIMYVYMYIHIFGCVTVYMCHEQP